MCQVSFDSYPYFQKYASDKLIIAKIEKGNNSVITWDRASILVCTLSLIALYQCIKFHLICFYTFRYAQEKLFIAKIKNGSNFIYTGDGDTVLAILLETCLGQSYFCKIQEGK